MAFGIKELVVVLIIVMLVFGTKKLRGVGADVGGWIRDFRNAVRDAPVVENDDVASDTDELVQSGIQGEKETA